MIDFKKVQSIKIISCNELAPPDLYEEFSSDLLEVIHTKLRISESNLDYAIISKQAYLNLMQHVLDKYNKGEKEYELLDRRMGAVRSWMDRDVFVDMNN